jgi:hypothetical protein
MPPHEPSRRLFEALKTRYAQPIRLGCNTVAHRDLGFCSGCAVPGKKAADEIGPLMELSGWRLMAIAERGVPDA